MIQIEVEHRGQISRQKFDELRSFFEQQAKFLGKKDRFSLIYFQPKSQNADARKSELIDLKLRITNGMTELVMKYGKNSGSVKYPFFEDKSLRTFWRRTLPAAASEPCACV